VTLRCVVTLIKLTNITLLGERGVTIVALKSERISKISPREEFVQLTGIPHLEVIMTVVNLFKHINRKPIRERIGTGPKQ
jgi:hypothetical protein